MENLQGCYHSPCREDSNHVCTFSSYSVQQGNFSKFQVLNTSLATFLFPTLQSAAALGVYSVSSHEESKWSQNSHPPTSTVVLHHSVTAHLLKPSLLTSEAFLHLLLPLYVSMGSLEGLLEVANGVPEALDRFLVIVAIPRHTVSCFLLPGRALLLALLQVCLGNFQLPLYHQHTVDYFLRLMQSISTSSTCVVMNTPARSLGSSTQTSVSLNENNKVPATWPRVKKFRAKKNIALMLYKGGLVNTQVSLPPSCSTLMRLLQSQTCHRLSSYWPEAILQPAVEAV